MLWILTVGVGVSAAFFIWEIFLSPNPDPAKRRRLRAK